MRARLRKTLELLRCAASYWSSDNSSNTGAALAFYCAFSIAPGLVTLTAAADFLLSLTGTTVFAPLVTLMKTRQWLWC